MSLESVVKGMIQEGAFRQILVNPSSQFGRPRREYLGARILPERLVPNNSYMEAEIKYRTVLALDSNRYSPPIKRGNYIMGSMRVDLSEQDIASEFTAEDYDNFIAVNKLNTLSAQNQGNPEMFGAAQLGNWFDQHINLALVEKIEKMRWQAIVDAQVELRGANGYSEDVALPNPAGHRVAASDDWTDPTFNPLDDIYAMADVLDAKGMSLGWLIAGRPVVMALLRNPLVQAAVGGFISISGGTLQGSTRRLTLTNLNDYLAQEGLPPILQYNLKWRDQVGDDFFLKRDVLVGIAATGRDQSIDLGDDEQLPLRDTAGYVGVGRAAGQAAPGRASYQQVFENKPPRVEFEGWQTSFPIIQDPESIVVTHTITTS